MNVANIRPGDELRVELRYAELLVPEKHAYAFVHPRPVDPYYSDQPAPETAAGAAGDAAQSTFALTATLRSGVPIRMVEAPSHPQARITREQPTVAALDLPASREAGSRRR